MPNLNAIMLSGFIFTKPKEIPVDKTGKYYVAASFKITIERKRMPNAYDKLQVICYNETAEKALGLGPNIGLKIGDYIISDEVNLITTNYKHEIEFICPQCHNLETKEVNSEKTECVIRDYVVIPHARPESLLGVNKAILIGNACTAVNYYKFPRTGRGQSKFKLAVDRSGALKQFQHADYPYVVSYGKEADYIHENLEVGGMLMVEGWVLQREILQNFSHICSECETAFSVSNENTITEIFATRVILFKHAETKTQDEILSDEQEDKNNVVEYEDEVRKRSADEYSESLLKKDEAKEKPVKEEAAEQEDDEVIFGNDIDDFFSKLDDADGE